MGTKKYIALPFIIGALLTLTSTIQAQDERFFPVMWSHTKNYNTGLYTTSNDFNQDGFSFGADILYYSGDFDVSNGVPLFGKDKSGKANFTPKAFTAALNAAYHQPISTHFGMRYTLSLGALRGYNSDERNFLSIFVQPAVGVECYPINHYGLMLYAGLALHAGFFPIYHHGEEPNPKYTFSPNAQLGIGYSWNLSNQWMVTVDLMGTYALLEFNGNHHIGMDGFGKGTGFVAGEYNGKATKFNEHDGYFQLGISFTYRFNHCEHCRILHNYGRVDYRHKRW